MSLEWSEPPVPREPGYNVDWEQVITELRARPGQWAKVTETSVVKRAHDLSRNLRDGRYKAVPPDSVEVVARTIHGGRGGLWMRWTGSPNV